jgi:hypothetical protein
MTTANPHFDPDRIAGLNAVVDGMADVLLAEHRAEQNGKGSLSNLISRGLWEAAQELGRAAAVLARVARPSDEEVVEAGAAMLIEGRPGSWESAIVFDWVREGENVRPDSPARVRKLVGYLTKLAQWPEPAPDIADRLSQALGRAAIEVGSVDALVGYAWLDRLEAMTGPYGPQPA